MAVSFQAGFLGSAAGFVLLAVSASASAHAEASEASKPALAEAAQPSLRPELDAGDNAWPSYRGADRTGVSDEAGLLDSWPATGPRELWRIAAGPGYSGVSIAGGKAITMWQEEGEQRLIALDSVSGKVAWKHSLSPAFASPYGDGPRSTPVIDGERVFAIDARGRLAAVRVEDGRAIWSRDLEKEFGARIPSIGYASTPLLEGDYLLVEVGGPEGAFVAFDASTGEVVWKAQSDEPAYASPIAFTSKGRRQVVFFSASGLYALAPETGSLLWRHPWRSPCPATGIPLNGASPVFVAPDRLFVSSAWGDHKGGGVLQIVESGDELGVETLWHAPLINSEVNTAILVGTHLYGFKGSILVALEAATGNLSWSTRGYGRGSLIAADGKLIVLGENGELGLIAANPVEFQELSTAQVLSGRSWTSPSLAGRRLFVRNGAEVVSYDLAGENAAARPGAKDGSKSR